MLLLLFMRVEGDGGDGDLRIELLDGGDGDRGMCRKWRRRSRRRRGGMRRSVELGVDEGQEFGKETLALDEKVDLGLNVASKMLQHVFVQSFVQSIHSVEELLVESLVGGL